jgi:hypothetical protein
MRGVNHFHFRFSYDAAAAAAALLEHTLVGLLIDDLEWFIA